MTETLYTRTGECNQCGECCSDLPWAMKPAYIRNRTIKYVKKLFPPAVSLIPFVRVRNMDDWKIKPKKDYDSVQRGSNTFHYIFTDGGLHKDLEPYGDSATVSRECPFLLPDNGDGKRPCGLYNTKSHAIWQDHCSELNAGVPPRETTREVIDRWFRDHPNCSFEYV